jgi:hypothetical protein
MSPARQRPARRLSFLLLLAPAVLGLPVSACIWIFGSRQVASVERPAVSDSVTVQSALKAHLVDGATIVYQHGATLTRDTVWGAGIRYNLTLTDSAPVRRVPLDSVLGMESFRTHVNTGASIAVSTLATVPAIAATVAVLACLSNPKCFGSCPTFYSDSAGTFVLQAEGFSYSVASLFEARDVDRLHLRADSSGVVRLEVRNEALETHYINHLELLEVRHAEDEFVLPDERGRAVAVRSLIAPTSIRDRAGRDERATLGAADGVVFRTDRATLDGVSVRDMEDYLDVVLPNPGVDSVAIVLRLRNSLLNTVLLYELMLGAPGARALDWMGQDLEQIGPAAELGRWYARRMGMRVAVMVAGTYHDAARISDTGPVAWNDIAAVIPVPPSDSLRIRLSFTADDWRIDELRVAAGVRRPPTRAIEPTAVFGRDGEPDSGALASIAAVDQRYLQTSPGDRFTIRFDAGSGPVSKDSARTFLLASQGYYTEWVRGSWLKSAQSNTAFVPSDSMLLEALVRWRDEQASLEQRFAATRVPVR